MHPRPRSMAQSAFVLGLVTSCGPQPAAPPDTETTTSSTTATDGDPTSDTSSAGDTASSSGDTGPAPPPPGGLGPWGFGYVLTDIEAQMVTLGDFDGDGHVDIFAQRPEGMMQLRIFNGDGTGSFTLESEMPATGWLDLMRTGDFDGDGSLDVMSFDDLYEAHFGLALNDGQGAIAEALMVDPDLAGDSVFWPVTPFDYDGDAALDLFVTLLGGRVLVNQGDATYTADVMVDQVACYLGSLAPADLDGDGLDEVIATGSCNSVPDYLPLAIYRHVGDSFTLDQTIIADQGPVLEGSDILVLDVDEDGSLDVVTPTRSGLYIAYGDGTGGLADPPQMLAHDYPEYTQRVVPLRPTADGPPAFALEAYRSSLDEVPPDSALIELIDAGGLATNVVDYQGRIMDAADIDEDGRPDLVVLVGEYTEGIYDGHVGIWLSGG